MLNGTYPLNQKNPSDINKAAGISLVDDEDKRYFSMLPVGQAIIKLQDKWRKPFLVQFPLMNFQKGLVTDSVLAKYLRHTATGSARKTPVLPEFQQVPQIGELEAVNIAQKGHYRIKQSSLNKYIESKRVRPFLNEPIPKLRSRSFPKVKNYLGL